MSVPSQIIRLSSDQIQLSWPEYPQLFLLNAEQLRRACPCAECQAGAHQAIALSVPKKSIQLNVVQQSKNDMCRISSIWPVGNYALGIEFQDGHRSGIFTFRLLYELCVSSTRLP